jgi:cell division protein FtsB
LEIVDDKNKLNLALLIEELQGKFDKVYEYVRKLKEENESLRARLSVLEDEVEKLKRENEKLKSDGLVLFSADEKEDLKKRIVFLLDRINRYL